MRQRLWIINKTYTSCCKPGLPAFILAALFLIAVNPACAKEPENKKAASPQQTQKTQTAQPEPSKQQPVPESAAPEKATDTVPQQAVPAQAAQEPTAPAKEKKTETKVDVYLFHGSYRCYSCNVMEELTIEVVDEQFSAEKKAGTVAFHHINVEEPDNRHFIQDYRIAAISIILSRKSGGRETTWKNLDKVWMLLRDRAAFKNYIAGEIKAYLQ